MYVLSGVHLTRPPNIPSHTQVSTAACLAVQVICVDNFFTGSKENVAHLIGKVNFELIRHDVVEKLLLEVDQIFHLACPASPVHYKCASSWPSQCRSRACMLPQAV